MPRTKAHPCRAPRSVDEPGSELEAAPKILSYHPYLPPPDDLRKKRRLFKLPSNAGVEQPMQMGSAGLPSLWTPPSPPHPVYSSTGGTPGTGLVTARLLYGVVSTLPS